MNIKKASALLDLTPDTIRYYERIGVVTFENVDDLIADLSQALDQLD